MATESQLKQLSGGLNTLKSTDLGKASSEQRAALSKTLSNISSLLSKSKTSNTSGGGSSSSITSDSTSATRTESSIGRDITDIANRSGVGDAPDTSALEDLQRAQEKEIERQRKLLEARRTNAIEGINAGFDVEKTATEFQQKRETGQTSVDLARAGGYLGVTASQSGVMQNLVIAQRAELTALQSARQDAINQANQAYEDRDFELAKEKLKSAREIEAEIFNRKNVFFTQQMDMLGEERAQSQNQREATQFLRDQANDRLDRILEAGISPDITDLTEISKGLGVSIDEANAIVKAAKEARDLALKDQKTDRELAIIAQLRGIPRDRSVVIDGVTYQGLAEMSSSGSGGGTAAERQAARENQLRAMLMEDIRGGFFGGEGDAQGETIDPITLDEAILTYPELDTKYIEAVFNSIKGAKDTQMTKEKIGSGEWDVAVIDFPGDSQGPQEIVYEKAPYEAAIKRWAETTGPNSDSGWYAGEYQGSDAESQKAQVTITINGVEYTGKGTYDYQADKYVPPVDPTDYQIVNF